MKKTIVLSVLFFMALAVKAQEKVKIATGTKLQYAVSVQGRTFPIFIRVDSLSATQLILGWNYEDGRSGRFVATKSSIDSATLGYYNPPIDGEEVLLPGNQQLLFISKSVFSSLQKTGKAVFDGANVTVKPSAGDNTFRLLGQLIDVLQIESESGAKFWILNNAASPVIVKTENNPAGVDVELMSIE